MDPFQVQFPPTHHDAKSLLHNIDNGGLCFLPDLCSSSLIDVRLHLHQRLQSKRLRKICLKIFISSPSICLGPSFEASGREVVWCTRTSSKAGNILCHDYWWGGILFSGKPPGNTRRSQRWHLSGPAQAPLDWKYRCLTFWYWFLLFCSNSKYVCLPPAGHLLGTVRSAERPTWFRAPWQRIVNLRQSCPGTFTCSCRRRDCSKASRRESSSGWDR